MLTSRTLFQPSQEPALLICTVDPGELTTEQAHRGMQVHLECGVDTCKVRRRARSTLVANNRMVLDCRAMEQR